MNGRRRLQLSLACLAACGAAAVLCAADAPAKVELKLGKGDTFRYTVTTASATEGGDGQGAFRRSSTAEVLYAIKVEDKKDGGDLVLSVTYVSVKIKEEGGRGAFEFDSAKPSGGAETAELEKIVNSAIKVIVADGKVKEVTGFPEAAQTAAGRGAKSGAAEKGPRRMPASGGFFRGMNVAGAIALTRDLTYILSPPIQGVALEEGKTYQAAAVERSAAEGKGRGGAGRMAGLNLAYTYVGLEGEAVKFAVLRKAPQSARGGLGAGMGPGAGLEARGDAFVTLKDGLLRKLELKSASEEASERSGRAAPMKSSMTITVARAAAK